MWHLFAADAGPCQMVEGLAGNPGFIRAPRLDGRCAWEKYMQRNDVSGIVVGTSRSESGFALEVGCRTVARRLGLPVVCIEDYPGNYQHLADAEADLLIVESDFAVNSTNKRLGSACPIIAVGASLRYDHLRRQKNVAISFKPKSKNVLWIGQPETEDSLISLSRLLPKIENLELKLLFRAHPRDLGYSRGCYRHLFKRYLGVIQDVSVLPMEHVFGLRPCLTLTHFSSLAIELGFYGIPLVHLLFPDAGGARLKSLVGYCVPHVCEAGASVAISSEKDLDLVLLRVIEDDAVRLNMMERFGSYFDTAVPQANKVISRINSLFTQI